MLDEVGREFPPDLWLLHLFVLPYIYIYEGLEFDIVEANDPWEDSTFN